MARTPPSRVSSGKIMRELRAAARKGDRAALTLAVDQMRTLALSPRYWEKYLGLLRNPFARLVDLLVIKQGERIAHQKGWKKPGGGLRPPSKLEGAAAAPSKPPHSRGEPQPSPSKPPRLRGARPPLRGRSPRSKRGPSRPRRAPATMAEQPSLFDL